MNEIDAIKSLNQKKNESVDGAWTAEQLRRIWQCGEDRARRIIKKSIEDGKMEYFPVLTTNVCGVSRMSPAYRLKVPKGK